MKVSELIEILENNLKEHGDARVYLISFDTLKEFTYLGYGHGENWEGFWLTTNPEFFDSDEDSEHFKAPSYGPNLRIVK